MSGTFCFGDDLVVVVNNAGMGVLDNLLRPFFKDKEIGEKIYFHYDLYDGPIDFSVLTSEQYMEAYTTMLKAFESDLKENPIIDNHSRQWAVGLWFNELKPKMQSSPLYVQT